MCKLLIAQTLTPNNAEMAKIITLQFPALASQPDGVGALVVTHDDKLHVFRHLTDYQSVFDQVTALLPSAKLVALHTRVSTGGTTDLTNVHFFERNNTYFAHNGWIDGYDKPTTIGVTNAVDCLDCYSSKKGTCRRHTNAITKTTNIKTVGDCDSLQFLTELTQSPQTTLEDLAELRNFYGVGFLYDKKKKEATLFSRGRVNNPIQSLSDNATFSVFFSYIPTLKGKKTSTVIKTIFGVPVIQDTISEEITTNLIPNDTPDGFYTLTTHIDQETEVYTMTEKPTVPQYTPRPLGFQTPTTTAPVTLDDDDTTTENIFHCDSCSLPSTLDDLIADEDSGTTLCGDCYRAFGYQYA